MRSNLLCVWLPAGFALVAQFACMFILASGSFDLFVSKSSLRMTMIELQRWFRSSTTLEA